MAGDNIQDKPGRLVALVAKRYSNGYRTLPWVIEATWQVKDWTGEYLSDLTHSFPEGTIGTDVKGPFLFDSMKNKPEVYPRPFIHLVIIGDSTYYVSDVFLADAYEHMNVEKPK